MAKDQVRFLKEELADTIKEFELVEKSVYDSELAHAINTGGAVYDSLIKENAFQIEDLLKKLSSKYGLKSEENPRPMMPEIKKFPLQYCLENALIPIGETDKVVEFGICVPNSLNALKNLSLMIGKKTSAKFIPPFYILQSIQQKHIHTEVDVPKSDLVKDKKEIIARENKPKKVELGMEVMEDKLKKESEVILDLDALGANEQKDKKLEDNVNLAELSKDIKKDSKPDIKIPESDGPVIELNLPDEEDEPSKPKAQQQPKKSESIKKSVTTKKPVAEISGDVVSVVDEILSEAVMNGTSDVHIEIFKDIAQIRYRNGGTLLIQSQYKVFIAKNYNAVVARIKILANLDIAERRLPQDGKISYTAKDGTEVDFRISILPTSLGERIVIRILNSSSLAVTIGAIGFTKKTRKRIYCSRIFTSRYGVSYWPNWKW